MRFLFFLLTFATLCIGANFACDPRYQYEPQRHRRHQEVIGAQLEAVRGLLLDYRDAHGRFPTNDEGLGVLTEGTEDLVDPEFPELAEIELWRMQRGYFDKEDSLPRLRSGIWSAWLVPFGYENRIGLPPGTFDGSPADEDPDRRWSIEVDDGICVWCVGARADARAWDVLRREQFKVGLLAYGLPLLFGVLFLWSLHRAPAGGDGLKTWNRIKYGAAGVFFFIWLGFAAGPQVTCYMMMYFGSRQRGKRVAEYRAVLRDYRARGVLSARACERLLTALDQDEELTESTGR